MFQNNVNRKEYLRNCMEGFGIDILYKYPQYKSRRGLNRFETLSLQVGTGSFV